MMTSLLVVFIVVVVIGLLLVVVVRVVVGDVGVDTSVTRLLKCFSSRWPDWATTPFQCWHAVSSIGPTPPNPKSA